jgi:hypothetical protein
MIARDGVCDPGGRIAHAASCGTGTVAVVKLSDAWTPQAPHSRIVRVTVILPESLLVDRTLPTIILQQRLVRQDIPAVGEIGKAQPRLRYRQEDHFVALIEDVLGCLQALGREPTVRITWTHAAPTGLLAGAKLCKGGLVPQCKTKFHVVELGERFNKRPRRAAKFHIQQDQ